MRAEDRRTPALQSRRARATRAPGVAVCMRAGVCVCRFDWEGKFIRTLHRENGTISGGTYEVAVGIAERRDSAGRHFVDATNTKSMSEFFKMVFGLVVLNIDHPTSSSATLTSFPIVGNE